MGKGLPPSEAGFTLVEVLVALVLLCLLTVTLCATCSSSSLWLGQAGKHLQAADHAMAIIEHMRAGASRINSLAITQVNPYVFSDSDTSNNALELPALGISIPDPLGLEEQITIRRLTDEQLFYVEVTVYWLEGGRRRSTIASSLISVR